MLGKRMEPTRACSNDGGKLSTGRSLAEYTQRVYMVLLGKHMQPIRAHMNDRGNCKPGALAQYTQRIGMVLLGKNIEPTRACLNDSVCHRAICVH